MWNKLDELDEQYSRRYTIKDLYDAIRDEYELTEINTKVASKKSLDRFKRAIKRNYDKLDNVGKIQAQRYLRKAKVNNNEILEFMIYIIYSLQQVELDTITNVITKDIAEYTYEQEVQELSNKLNKPIPKRPSFSGLVALWMASINSRGYVWKDYISGVVSYNANETYRHLAINGLKGLKDLLKKQKRRLINKKKEPSEDKYSGTLDDQMVMIANLSKIQAYKDMDVKRVRFISVHDKATTRMCKSLNGQVFEIDGMNKYDRYSAVDDKIVRYTTKGLKVGDNLPPINNHFHWCRSTITYQIGDNK